jgi:hypothetical protein
LSKHTLHDEWYERQRSWLQCRLHGCEGLLGRDHPESAIFPVFIVPGGGSVIAYVSLDARIDSQLGQASIDRRPANTKFHRGTRHGHPG